MANQGLQDMTGIDYFSVPANVRSTSTSTINDMTSQLFAQPPSAPHQSFMQNNSQQILPENYHTSTIARNAYNQQYSGTAPSTMQPYRHPNYQGPNFQLPQNSTGYQSYPQSSVPVGHQNTASVSFNNAASHAHGERDNEQPRHVFISDPQQPNQVASQRQETVQQIYSGFPQHQESNLNDYSTFSQYPFSLPGQNVALTQQRPMSRQNSAQFQPQLPNEQQMKRVTSASNTNNMAIYEQIPYGAKDFAPNIPQQHMLSYKQPQQQPANFALDNQYQNIISYKQYWPPTMDSSSNNQQQNTVGYENARQQTTEFAPNNQDQNRFGHEQQARQQTADFNLGNQPQKWGAFNAQENVTSSQTRTQSQSQSHGRMQPHAPMQMHAYPQAQAQMQAQIPAQIPAQMPAQAPGLAQVSWRQTQVNQASNSNLQNRAHPNRAGPSSTRMGGTQQLYPSPSACETHQSGTSQHHPMLQGNCNGKRTAEDDMLSTVSKRRKSPTSLPRNLSENQAQNNSYMAPSSARASSQNLRAFQQDAMTGIQRHDQSAQISGQGLTMLETTQQNHQGFQARSRSGSTFSTSEESVRTHNTLTNTSSQTPHLQRPTSTLSHLNAGHHFQGPRQPGQPVTYASFDNNASFHHEPQQRPQMPSNGRMLNNMSAPTMPHPGPRQTAPQVEQQSSRPPFPANAISVERTPSVLQEAEGGTKESVCNSQLSVKEVSPGNAQRCFSADSKTLEPCSATGQLRHTEDFSKSANNMSNEGSVTSRKISEQAHTNAWQSTDKGTGALVTHNTTASIQNPRTSISAPNAPQNTQSKKPRKPYTRKPKPREQTIASPDRGIRRDFTGRKDDPIILDTASQIQHTDPDEEKLLEALAPYMASNVSADFSAPTPVSKGPLPSVNDVKFWLLSHFIKNLSLERPCPFNVEVFRSDVGTKTLKEVEDPLNVVHELIQISLPGGHSIQGSCTLWTRKCRIMPPPEVQPSKPAQPGKRRKKVDPQVGSTPLNPTSERWNYRYETGVDIQNIRLNEIRMDDTSQSFLLQRKNAVNGTAHQSVEHTWCEIVQQLQNQVQAWSVPRAPPSFVERAQPATQRVHVSPAKVPTAAEASMMITTQRKNDCVTPEHIGDSPPQEPVPKFARPLPLTPPDVSSKSNTPRPTQVQQSRGNDMQKQLSCANTVASQTNIARRPEFVKILAGLQQQGTSPAFMQPPLNKTYEHISLEDAIAQSIRDEANQAIHGQQATYVPNYHPVAAGSNSAAPSFGNTASRQHIYTSSPGSMWPGNLGA